MRKKPTIRMKSKETAAEVLELFLLTKRADGVKPRTIETYKQHFHAISKHLDINQEIAEMTATDLKMMIVSMQDSGLAPNSIKSYTITLKAFLSWCNDEGITSLNMKKYKGEETIKETYTDEELKILLQKPNMKKCTFAEYRTWVVVNLLINSGSRAATIRNIQIRDVDMENNVIYARHTKNSRSIPIPPKKSYESGENYQRKPTASGDTIRELKNQEVTHEKVLYSRPCACPYPCGLYRLRQNHHPAHDRGL